MTQRLVPVLGRPSDPVRFDPLLPGDDASPDGWRLERGRIRNVLQTYLGEEPELVDPPVISWSGDEDAGDHLRRRLTYATGDGDEVTALLLVPSNAGDAPMPGVLALHQTVRSGKAEAAGLDGDPELAYGLELVRRGYVVLVPDAFVFGERRDEWPLCDTAWFYRRYPRWSAIGKMVHDHRQGLSVLGSLAEVDSRRMGAIGHSLGGLNAYWLAALDERVRATVASCAFTTLAGSEHPEWWATAPEPGSLPPEIADLPGASFIFMPSMKRWLMDGRSPFDLHQVVALIAPRAIFLWLAEDDALNTQWRWSIAGLEEVRKVYDLTDQEAAFVTRVDSGGHAFPKALRDSAYDFLDLWLKA